MDLGGTNDEEVIFSMVAGSAEIDRDAAATDGDNRNDSPVDAANSTNTGALVIVNFIVFVE
jgi:hypothetical protein